MSKAAGKLANRYARALLRAVEREQGSNGEPSPAQQVGNALASFAHAWESEKLLSTSILNPMFDKAERQSALLQIARNAGLPDVLIRFLEVVFDRDRIAALPQISSAFSEMADAAAGMVQVEVVTARGISDEERGRIQENLGGRLFAQSGSARRLEFRWKISPEILGGMVVKFGGKVLDGSVKGRIERIERALVA